MSLAGVGATLHALHRWLGSSAVISADAFWTASYLAFNGVADAILDVTERDDIVLDPFAGIGTTIIAAEKTGRHGRAIERDPRYCDVIIRRWQHYAGKTARS